MLRAVILLATALPLISAEPVGGITGSVVSLQDASVARARVQIRHAGSETSIEAITPVTGAFAFDGLSPGKYHLLVTASGFRPYVIQDITVSGGEIRDLGRAWMEPAQLPTEIVVDTSYITGTLGQPLQLPIEIPLCLRFPGNPVLVFGPGGGLHVKFSDARFGEQPAPAKKERLRN